MVFIFTALILPQLGCISVSEITQYLALIWHTKAGAAYKALISFQSLSQTCCCTMTDASELILIHSK